MLDLYILTLLAIISSIFAPFYFWIRHRMTIDAMRDKPVSYFTRRRIKKFYLFVLVSILSAFVLSLLIILGIKLRASPYSFNDYEVSILLFYVFAWIIISNGAGLYVSGVFIEQYTMSNLKNDPEYTRLKIATKLLHGQISHVCIFSGGMAALFAISIFEFLNPTKIQIPLVYVAYAAIGLVLGIIYSSAQIRNKTWKNQIPFFTIISILDICLLLFNLNLLLFPFNIFFFCFSVSATVFLLVYEANHSASKFIDRLIKEKVKVDKEISKVMN